MHATPDKDAALRLRTALAELNVLAFVDRPDVNPGVPWDTTIERELRDSLLQVVLVGQSTRWYQHEEVHVAIQEMRAHGAADRVVPVLLEPRVLLPYGLNRVQAITWDDPSAVAARLAERVATLRGGRIVDGKLSTTQPRVRMAVVGLGEELFDALDRLRRRLGQHTAILDGEVRMVDLRDTLPDVDLRVVLLGSRHGTRLDVVRELVSAATCNPAERNTIVGAIDVPLRQIPASFKAEAYEMQSLEIAITATSAGEVIDRLDAEARSWYGLRFPSRPGMSITREVWEQRYLDDKVPVWHRGDPSALRTLGGARADRVRWYVHLKAEWAWGELELELFRNQVTQDPWARIEMETAAFQFVKVGSHQPQDESWWSYYLASQPLTHIHLWLASHHGTSVDRTRNINSVERTVSISTDDMVRSVFFTSDDKPTAPAPRMRHWLDVLLSLAPLPRCVVVGAAGAGKTVLLQHLAWILATDEAAGTASNPVHRVNRAAVRGDCPIAPLPVLHSATTLVEHLRTERPIREALVALLRSSETFGDVADTPTLRAGIDAGRYVFLIDSLDEVPRRQDREALVAALGTLTGPAPRVVLTTRPSAHTAVELPDGFARFDIAPLDADDARRLIRAWIDCWALGGDLTHVMRAVESLRQSFPAQGSEHSPVENPLLLSCILQVYALYRRLPDDTAKLYHDMVRVLCEAKIRAADDRERDTLVERYREALRDLSLASQELGGAHLPVAAAHDLLVASGFASRSIVENRLHALANHTGLVRFDGIGDRAVLLPWHRSYQEYLAAEAIALQYANRASACVDWLRALRPERGSRLRDPSWRGTLSFLIGAAVHQHRTWGVNLVNALMTAATTRSPDQARLLALAAEGCSEYATSVFQNEPMLQALPQQVIGAFSADDYVWPVDDRLDALDAVGRLGDTRLRDPQRADQSEVHDAWVLIPAGAYVIGTDHTETFEDVTADSVATMGKGLALPRTTREIVGLWMRRWSVTVAEFLPFIESLPQGLGSPYDGTRWRQLASGWRAQGRSPSRPIVGVDWFVARAFCAWVQVNWRLPEDGVVDLPTSAEWEAAARRHTERVFPWGNEPADADGTIDGRIVTPPIRGGAIVANPVGAFPGSHTPEGLWDLVGNVLEWCASRHAGALEYDLPINSGADVPPFCYMVCRGGRWFHATPLTQRSGYGPSTCNDTIGFRLICRSRSEPIHTNPPCSD